MNEKIQKNPKIRVWYLFMLKFSASVPIRYSMVPNNRGELLLIIMHNKHEIGGKFMKN